MLLMGLDVGTTGVKAAVFDETGEMKGYGFEEYEVVCEKSGWAEQDAERAFQAACRVMGEAAVVSYIRLVQKLDGNGAPITVSVEETRVWQKKKGTWKHVHFHRSPC